jgi:hypothetical protein
MHTKKTIIEIIKMAKTIHQTQFLSEDAKNCESFRFE